MVSPLGTGNALIFVDAGVSRLEAGAEVKVVSTRFEFNSVEQKDFLTK